MIVFSGLYHNPQQHQPTFVPKKRKKMPNRKRAKNNNKKRKKKNIIVWRRACRWEILRVRLEQLLQWRMRISPFWETSAATSHLKNEEGNFSPIDQTEKKEKGSKKRRQKIIKNKKHQHSLLTVLLSGYTKSQQKKHKKVKEKNRERINILNK